MSTYPSLVGIWGYTYFFVTQDFHLIALIRPNIIFVTLPVILASISSSKSSLASAESLLKLNNV